MSALSFFQLGGPHRKVALLRAKWRECVQHFGESVPFRKRLKISKVATALLAVPRRRHRGGI